MFVFGSILHRNFGRNWLEPKQKPKGKNLWSIFRSQLYVQSKRRQNFEREKTLSWHWFVNFLTVSVNRFGSYRQYLTLSVSGKISTWSHLKKVQVFKLIKTKDFKFLKIFAIFVIFYGYLDVLVNVIKCLLVLIVFLPTSWYRQQWLLRSFTNWYCLLIDKSISLTTSNLTSYSENVIMISSWLRITDDINQINTIT